MDAAGEVVDGRTFSPTQTWPEKQKTKRQKIGTKRRGREGIRLNVLTPTCSQSRRFYWWYTQSYPYSDKGNHTPRTLSIFWLVWALGVLVTPIMKGVSGQSAFPPNTSWSFVCYEKDLPTLFGISPRFRSMIHSNDNNWCLLATKSSQNVAEPEKIPKRLHQTIDGNPCFYYRGGTGMAYEEA